MSGTSERLPAPSWIASRREWMNWSFSRRTSVAIAVTPEPLLKVADAGAELLDLRLLLGDAVQSHEPPIDILVCQLLVGPGGEPADEPLDEPAEPVPLDEGRGGPGRPRRGRVRRAGRPYGPGVALADAEHPGEHGRLITRRRPGPLPDRFGPADLILGDRVGVVDDVVGPGLGG